MSGQRAIEEPEPTLRLRRLDADVRGEVARLLSEARFQRRTMFSGLHELHPVDWSERRRTFVAERGGTLVGSTELLRDEDDPDTWEISLALTGDQRGDGGSAAAATLYYAFEVIGAQSVFFWAPDENLAVTRLAEHFGFARLHPVRLPGGTPAHAFELDAATWRARDPEARSYGLEHPVVVEDGTHVWRGTAEGFIRIG